MRDSVTVDTNHQQRRLDAAAAHADAVTAKARRIERGYRARGIIVAYELCHQEAEQELAEGPDREGE